MSLKELESSLPINDDSEEDEEMYIPIPYRFHDLAQQGESKVLDDEIKRYMKRDYNPNEVVLSLDQEDNLGYTPLHFAILSGSIDTIRVCVDNGVNLELRTEGIPYSIFLLHVEASKSLYQDKLWEVLQLLVIPEKVNTYKDRLDRTIAHIAASFNMVSVLEHILSTYPTLVDMVDLEKNSILFAACRTNSVSTVQFIMDSYPQVADLQNLQDQNALHICLESNALECYQTLLRCRCPSLDVRSSDRLGEIPLTLWKRVMEQKRESNSPDFPHEPFKTLLLAPRPFTDHQTCAEPPSHTTQLPPEQVERARVLLSEARAGSLGVSSLRNRVEVRFEDRPAALPTLLRVHDVQYLMRLIDGCEHARKANHLHAIDIDTSLSSKSFLQARRAAQTVCSAVDQLYQTSLSNSKIRNVFCVVRPPGHHIGTSGAVPNPNNPAVTQGFCLLNNVAIGAAYARATYGSFARVAIVDLDIHHGNGTEDCILHLNPCRTVSTSMMGNMQIQLENFQYKPWKDETDAQNVFFASLHGFGKLGQSSEYFYPGSGLHRNRVEFVDKETSGIPINNPTIIDASISKHQAAYPYYWRQHLRENVFPQLLEFHPDLIFLSFGFDGHTNDRLNNGFGGLTEFDFAWATREIVRLANEVCDGRIISVLEGGYDVRGGCTSPFALSVLSHVASLTEAFYMEGGRDRWEKEGEMERENVEKRLAEKGERVESVAMKREEEEEKEEEEEEAFDFGVMSEEEKNESNEGGKSAANGDRGEAGRERTERTMECEGEQREQQNEQQEERDGNDDEDGSEDLENYEMPEIEAGEMDKIEDPLANEEPVEGIRRRRHAKVDYVALEAQLRKEEEEMRKKKQKLSDAE